jgi:hypothetical protein
MYIVLDQQNNPIALLENMMILDYNDKSVIGILIGDCFFGKQNHVIGKIFNEHAYLVSGDIIGKVARNENYISTAPTKEQMQAAWDILAHITKHTSDWITEKNTWATISFQESLS